jgi:hypothetical protein
MRLNRGSKKAKLNSASLQLFTNAHAFKKAAGYSSRTAGYARLFCCFLKKQFRTSVGHLIPREKASDRHEQNHPGVAGLFYHSLRW